MNSQLDFFYGKEAEQFNFFRVPKLLFKENRFKKLSAESKILYSLLLDRMSLSLKNGWVDSENRVFIYFTAKEAMEELNIASEKCSKIFSELDVKNGCGLIMKKRQGLCKPDIIYVMNFMSCISADKENEIIDNDRVEENDDVEERTSECEISGNSKIETPEVRKSNFRKFEKQTTGNSDTEELEIRKTKTKDNDFNNNKNNNTDFSDINPILSHQDNEKPKARDVMDEIREREKYRDLISENIEYEFLVKNYSQASADDVLETMLDAVCSKKDYIWLGDEEIPQVIIKSRLLKLDYGHIEYALDSIKRNYTNVRNPKKYLLATLYNSITSMDTYYTTAVNYDMHGNN